MHLRRSSQILLNLINRLRFALAMEVYTFAFAQNTTLSNFLKNRFDKIGYYKN